MISLKKYVVSDLTGRDLFYFELFKLDETDDTLSFDSNVKFQLKHKKIIGLIELLLSNHLPEQTKDAVAQQLFNSILKEKEYQKFYLSDEVLNKEGKLMMDNYELIKQITYKKLKDAGKFNVPVSAFHEPELFKVIEDHFCNERESIMEQSTSISKRLFESQLVTDELKHQYVSVYNNENKFYRHIAENGHSTYYILRNNKLIFAIKTQ